MKQNTTIRPKSTFSIFLVLGFFLASCNQSKSTAPNTSNTTMMIAGRPVLASCTKGVNAKISVNVAAIKNQIGEADPLWLKLRFNVVAPELQASGNTMRIYRIRGNGSEPVLDQTSLAVQTYDLNSGQPTINLTQALPATSVNSQSGLYVYLNDSQAQYQALKIAFFDSSGKAIENFNILIPEFLASVADYISPTNGYARSQFLIDLHPLKSTDTSAWTAATFDQYFQQYCF